MDLTQQKLKTLRAKQEVVSQKLSFLVLETVFIFGVPAIFGYFVGTYLEKNGIATVLAYGVPLLSTFLLSWYILLRKLKVLTEEVKRIEDEIQYLAPSKKEENKDEEGENKDLK